VLTGGGEAGSPSQPTRAEPSGSPLCVMQLVVGTANAGESFQLTAAWAMGTAATRKPMASAMAEPRRVARAIRGRRPNADIYGLVRARVVARYADFAV